MQWKQPEGLRRHWVLEEMDGELLFLQMPPGAAQGRVGDDVYDLRDGGMLRKRRTLAIDGAVVATLEEKAAGGGGTVHYGSRDYAWRPANPLGTRWDLRDDSGKAVFTFHSKQALSKTAGVDIDPAEAETAGPLLLLCWYVTVL
ncbi:MAG: hypothetical protein JNM66_26280 [Bryobacterales bacterium]|nr:hypothetical protein [Bryobacterales bacterium]